MIPEIGNFALSLAMGMALLIAILPLWGSFSRQQGLMRLAPSLCFLLLLMLVIAFASLVYALVTNDFSLLYVVNYSNRGLPIALRIASAWGAHEGSLLLWSLILAFWTFIITVSYNTLPLRLLSRMVAVLGLLNAAFLVVILFTANPFSRIFAYFPLDGKELNPVLQDVGLIIHPPLLYFGLIGLAIPFAWSIAVLSLGRLESRWLSWLRPWLFAAWGFLTLGILSGAYWAYGELGWGGWWFWDPVENAALMPWLTALALLHSLTIAEKKSLFKRWTLLLAIMTFSLCLLDIFLVRSGILISVHSFALESTRGFLLLFIFALFVSLGLCMFAFNAHRIKGHLSSGSMVSVEGLIYSNNLLLLAATLTILLGTLLPLIHSQLGLGAISVGAPFFNVMASWLVIPLLVGLILGGAINDKRNKLRYYTHHLLASLVISNALVFSAMDLAQKRIKLTHLFILILAVWLAISIIVINITRLVSYGRAHINARYLAMNIAHFGFAMMIIGILLSHQYGIERHVVLTLKGEEVQLGDYSLQLIALGQSHTRQYRSEKMTLLVKKDQRFVNIIYPEKRYYPRSSVMTSEVAIISDGLAGDIYTAPGEKVNEKSWTFRLYHKPFIRLVWCGGVLIACSVLMLLRRVEYQARFSLALSVWR